MREALLAVGAGLVAGAVAGLFGIGGGTLLVPILVLLLHRPQHVAHATSLVAIIVPAAVGAGRFAYSGEVAWVGAAAVAAGAIVGVQAGAALMPRVPARALRTVFAVFLGLLTVQLLVIGDGGGGEGGGTAISVLSLGAHVLLGLVAGTASALLGIGGGAIIVPGLSLLLGYGQHLAEGTSLAIILPTALLGAVAHARRGYTEWGIGWLLGAGGALGALLGSSLALALPADLLARAFGVLLAIVTLSFIRGSGSREAGESEAVGQVR